MAGPKHSRKPKGPNEASSLKALIKRAECLQEAIREATVKIRELMTLLKQHRKDSKSIQKVLASLWQLPSLHV